MNTKTQQTLFGSATGEWSTPQDLFDQLDREFHFVLDAAADERNAKCLHYLGHGGVRPDALADGVNWADVAAQLGQPGGSIWLNPVYGRGLQLWLTKAWEAAQSHPGCTVVVLLPARTDTAWFHAYAPMASEIRFLEGRLKFGGMEAGAPFPSMLLVFRPDNPGPYFWRTMK
jgi:phage N-6-adenine-methyltransferase